MKSKITLIKEVKDEHENILGYEMIIECDDQPNLRLGECEIKQNEKKK